MDDHIRRHADILVDHCTDVGPKDNVLIRAPVTADNLVVALYEQLGKHGARPTTSWVNPRAGRAYARGMTTEDFRVKDHRLAAMKETDVVILVRGGTNSAESSDIDPKKAAAAGRARQPVLEERLEKRWVMTQHPTPANAQKAGMSTEAWTDFVYDAINKNWAAQREFQEQMVEILDAASEVRIVSDDTDLRMSINDMGTINDYGRRNMPGGEVATTPVVDSVEGTLFVDLPFTENGREVQDAYLEFENGEVVQSSAIRNEDALTSLIETDDGSRHVGELGIGMNRDIDRLTESLLFDEKMGDTIHIALGNAVEECVPDDRKFNESGRHVDMLIDMSEESRIEVDGTVVQRNGVFRFEEAFEE